MTNIEKLFLYKHRYGIARGIIVLLVFTLLFLRLPDLVGGMATLEFESANTAENFSVLRDSLVNAPYLLLQKLSLSLFGAGQLALRLPSVVFGVALLFGLGFLIRHWHRERRAIIAVLLVATSSWFLHLARLGSPAVWAAAAIAGIILAASWLHHYPDSWWRLVAAAFVIGLALYAPFVPLLMFIALGIMFKQAKSIWLGWSARRRVTFLGILSLFGLPLLVSLAFGNTPFKDMLQIESLPSIGGYIQNVMDAFGYLFWRAEANPELHVGTVALLDIFTATMTALGLYHYEQHTDHTKTRFVLGGFFASLLLLGFGAGQQYNVLLLPYVYIFAATGVVTLLGQWYQIFPRNPVARVSALAPLAVLLIITSWYHANRYFIAWSNAPETKVAYAQQTKPLLDNLHTRETEGQARVLLIEESSVAERVQFLAQPLQNIKISDADALPGKETLSEYDLLYMDSSALSGRQRRLLPKPYDFVVSDARDNPVLYTVYKL